MFLIKLIIKYNYKSQYISYYLEEFSYYYLIDLIYEDSLNYSQNFPNHTPLNINYFFNLISNLKIHIY
jgi:hypothetical protein